MHEERLIQSTDRLAANPLNTAKTAKNMKHILMAATVVAMMTAGACSSNKTDSTKMADEANETRVDSGTTNLQGTDKDERDDAAEFMVKASEAGMYEVEASKLCEQKGTHKDVKSFAKMMVEQHEKAGSDLKKIADEKKVELPVALSPDMQSKLEDLRKTVPGVEFDHAYASMMQDAHEADRDLFKKAAEDVQDLAVKSFASDHLPMIEKHLEMLRPLEKRQDKRKDAM